MASADVRPSAAQSPVASASVPPGSVPGAPKLRSGSDGPLMGLYLTDMGKVINRLKRAQGQLAGVVRMLEEGRGCEDIVIQISAVSSALDRAGFAIVAAGLRQCLVESDGRETVHVQKLEKIFLSLA